MLTKEQIAEAEAEEVLSPESTVHCPQSRVQSPETSAQPPKLAVTLDLEFRAAEQMNCAVKCLERGDRRAARAHMQMSENLLNEAEIED